MIFQLVVEASDNEEESGAIKKKKINRNNSGENLKRQRSYSCLKDCRKSIKWR